MQSLFLRLYNSKEVFRAIKDERLFVEDFIEISQLVHSKVKVTWDWDKELEGENILLPKMSLQTLVNNSFLHAFKETGNIQAPQIVIRLRKDSDFYNIEVEDNGVGMDYVVPGLEQNVKSGMGIKINRDIMDYENARNGLKNEIIHKKAQIFETGTLAILRIDTQNNNYINKIKL